MGEQITGPELYDVDEALRVVAAYRRRNDQMSVAQVGIADQLATHLTRHFTGDDLEAAGLGILVAAGSAGALVAKGLDHPAAVLNILGLAAQRMVLDARAAREATTAPADPLIERPAVAAGVTAALPTLPHGLDPGQVC